MRAIVLVVQPRGIRTPIPPSERGSCRIAFANTIRRWAAHMYFNVALRLRSGHFVSLSCIHRASLRLGSGQGEANRSGGDGRESNPPFQALQACASSTASTRTTPPCKITFYQNTDFCHYFKSRRNAFSSSILMPSFFAALNFVPPGFSPTTTRSVSFETLPETLPPA